MTTLAITERASWLRLATRHARVRWVGAPLFFTGVAVLAGAVLMYLRGGSGWTVLLGLFGTGMGLASFGANHDASLAYALRVHRDVSEGQGLPVALAEELDEELLRDREGVLGLKPTPRTALALPLVAIGVQMWALLRLVGG